MVFKVPINLSVKRRLVLYNISIPEKLNFKFHLKFVSSTFNIILLEI